MKLFRVIANPEFHILFSKCLDLDLTISSTQIAKEESMLKHTPVFAVAGVLALGLITLGFAGKTTPATSGAFNVDSQHSDVQLITDGLTDWGKKKVNFTLGMARVNGEMQLDNANLDNSKLDLHIFPADSMAPVLGEDGKLKASWVANLANHTLVCFHSKKFVRTPDGKLQVTGDLVLTRIDRNVQLDPNEAYSGPVYGPPMVHHVTHEATLVFDITPATANGQKGAGLIATGSTSTSREQFPELVRAVLSTNWPPVVMDEKCTNPAGGSEDYRGFACTGTFMHAPGLPPAPVQVGEDYPGPLDFNNIVGNQLTIMVHLHLNPIPLA